MPKLTGSDYWATIEAAIEKWLGGEGSIAPPTHSELGIDSIVCGICKENQLTIPGLQPDEDEDAVVLACGHVLGYRCMEEWANVCKGEGQPLYCPVCRTPLAPRRCDRHRVQCMRMAGDQSFWAAVEKIKKMMADNAKSNEETKNCQNCACFDSRQQHMGYQWFNQRYLRRRLAFDPAPPGWDYGYLPVLEPVPSGGDHDDSPDLDPVLAPSWASHLDRTDSARSTAENDLISLYDWESMRAIARAYEVARVNISSERARRPSRLQN